MKERTVFGDEEGESERKALRCLKKFGLLVVYKGLRQLDSFLVKTLFRYPSTLSLTQCRRFGA